MKRKASIVSLVVGITAACFAFVLWRPHPPSQPPIPTTLDECHKQMLSSMSRADLDRIMAMTNEEEMVRFHFTAGSAMRNGWGLWTNSPLAQHLKSFGIQHPDDMSGAILGTLWCRLHSQPFRLEERGAFSTAWWRGNEPPPKSAMTPDGSEIAFREIVHVTGSNGLPRGVHIGRSKVDKSFWAFERDIGVYRLDGPMLERAQNEDYWRNWESNQASEVTARKLAEPQR